MAKDFVAQYGNNAKHLSERAIEWICDPKHSWLKNIRSLECMLRSVCAGSSDSTIEINDLASFCESSTKSKQENGTGSETASPVDLDEVAAKEAMERVLNTIPHRIDIQKDRAKANKYSGLYDEILYVLPIDNPLYPIALQRLQSLEEDEVIVIIKSKGRPTKVPFFLLKRCNPNKKSGA